MPSKDLKITFSGDSKSYRQEMDKAAVATGKFQKDAGSALTELAGVFGVNISAISQSFGEMSKRFTMLHQGLSTSAVKANLLQEATNNLANANKKVTETHDALRLAQEKYGKLNISGKASTEALAKAETELREASAARTAATAAQTVAQTGLTTATTAGTVASKIFKVALAATGVGLLVIAVGSLVAYFVKTYEGANKIKVALAAMGAVVRVVVDHFSSLGESLFKFFTLDFKGAGVAFKKAFTFTKTDFTAGGAAAELEKRAIALEEKERKDRDIHSAMNKQAAELRRDAKDTEEFSASKRIGFLKQARDLVIEVATDEIGDAKEALSIHQGKMALHKASKEELEKESELQAKINDLGRESALEQKGILREMKGINKELGVQEKEREQQQKNLEQRAAFSKWGVHRNNEWKREPGAVETTTDSWKKIPLPEYKGPALASLEHDTEKWAASAINAQNSVANNALTASSKFAAAWSGASTALVDASDAINTALNDIAVGTGEMIGTFLAGGDQAQSFGDMIAGAFADMAITVGKIAIAAGIATLGIKAAFESMNGFVAIAAGIALVALGTAVKGRLKSVASGGASSAASGGSGGNYNYDARQSMGSSKMQTVNVVVTGDLKAKGGDLVYVLNQEAQRKAFVT